MFIIELVKVCSVKTTFWGHTVCNLFKSKLMGFVLTGHCVTLSIFSMPDDVSAICASDSVFYPVN